MTLLSTRSAARAGRRRDETAYLNAFLEARRVEMRKEAAHSDTSRIDIEQQVFLGSGNFDLTTPLNWQVCGQSFSISGRETTMVGVGRSLLEATNALPGRHAEAARRVFQGRGGNQAGRR